jgi:hypothetical protein
LASPPWQAKIFAMREDHRRVSPRIGVEALCWEEIGGRAASSLIVDVSSLGARVERPYSGGRIEREVPLELELPDIDEVMWAKGEVCFDQVIPTRGPEGGPFGLLRRTGYRIVAAATRDLRLLREYVFDTDARNRRLQADELVFASCYTRG